MALFIPKTTIETEPKDWKPEPIESEVVPFKNVDETTYEAEKRALEAIVQFGQYSEAIEAGVTGSTFEDRSFNLLWREIERQYAEEAPDFFEAKFNLVNKGILTKEQAAAIDISEIPPADSTGSHVPARISRLLENASKRRIRELLAQAHLLSRDGLFEQALELTQKVQETSAQTLAGIDSELEQRRFDPANQPEEKKPLLALMGIPIIRRSNISTLVAPDKAGKSHVLAAMIRAVSTGESELQFTSDEVGKVVYIDCEQDEGDFWALMHYQARANPEKVAAYRLTGMSAAKARKALRRLFKLHKGAILFAIDGFADLISDVNDSEESNDFVAELMSLADEYECAITGVLHLNPGSEDKSRGHLGSQLGRKSETVLKIKIDGDERHLFTQRARKKPITEDKALRFAWNDERGGFMELEGTPGDAKLEAKREALEELISDVVANSKQGDINMEGWMHTVLCDKIMKIKGCVKRTAANKITEMTELGILKHSPKTGVYSLKMKCKK